MKCRYIYDTVAGKVLIPGCWGSAVYGIERCTCRNEHAKTFEAFERLEYRDALKEKDNCIKELEMEIARLNRIIKHLCKK